MFPTGPTLILRLHGNSEHAITQEGKKVFSARRNPISLCSRYNQISEKDQTTVIFEILRRLDWKLIATITSNEYTGLGTNKLFRMASQYGICNAYEETLPARHNRQKDQLVKTICHILLKTDTNVLVLLMDGKDTGQILDAIHTVQTTSPLNGIRCLIRCLILCVIKHKFDQNFI